MSCLFVVATPIGNLQDISARALATLREVQALICEDTRVTRKLLSRYEIPRPRYLFSAHEYNEHQAVARVIGLLNSGVNVAYTSDAGMPGVSDPGYLLIRGAREAGHDVVVVPGPSAAITALIASGLPSSGFAFLGFPPRKPGKRTRLLERVAAYPETLVFFESPNRLAQFLADALAVLGNRRAAVVIDLTKVFETVEQAWLSELVEKYAEPPKGEVTVVIAGDSSKFRRDEDE